MRCPSKRRNVGDGRRRRCSRRSASFVPLSARPADSSETTKDFDDETFVDAAYRRFLGREADPEGRRSYLETLRVKSRQELIESMIQSDEFRSRPLHVLVIPDHRVFNAATLQYLSESDEAPSELPPRGPRRRAGRRRSRQRRRAAGTLAYESRFAGNAKCHRTAGE